VKVFLDANILFSASHPGWLTGGLLASLSRHSRLVTTTHAIEEARHNLEGFDPGLLPGLQEWTGKIQIVPGAMVRIAAAQLPENDQPILAAAIASHSTHLLTGDLKHFGKLMGRRIQGVLVVSQRLLAEELQRKGLLDI
jgi:uncharacterized protein